MILENNHLNFKHLTFIINLMINKKSSNLEVNY